MKFSLNSKLELDLMTFIQPISVKYVAKVKEIYKHLPYMETKTVMVTLTSTFNSLNDTCEGASIPKNLELYSADPSFTFLQPKTALEKNKYNFLSKIIR